MPDANDDRDVEYFTPSSYGYSLINTDLGAMAVSLENIDPYATGSTVTQVFSIASKAMVDSLQATTWWGRLMLDACQIKGQ